jgi:tetratricopeptide (TPR) repeat protein
VAIVNCRRLSAFAILFCWAASGSPAHADWAACQAKPTRSCLMEEALRGESGPLTGKERLDVLIQANAIDHLEYTTAADIKEAQRLATPGPVGSRYFSLAIRGLVAAHQQQEAFDLAAGQDVVMRTVAFMELTRAMVKAGDPDKVVPLLKQLPPSVDPKFVVVEFVRTLAGADRIDDAVASIADIGSRLSEINTADMLTAVAQAYAKRGDTKMAAQYFDKAQASLQAGLQKAASGAPVAPNDISRPAIEIPFRMVGVLALRGDIEAVKKALPNLPSPPPNPADRTIEIARVGGYQRVVQSLLQAKQFQLALEIAKSMPGSAVDKNRALINVAVADAGNGRIDDARAILASLGDIDPRIQAGILESIAAATAKSGDVTSALQTAAQIGDPTTRKATLFMIAQALPQ